MALAVAGCRVDATVGVDVRGQSGEVTVAFVLDRQAAELLGDDFATDARVADLRRAGWTVGPLRRRASGASVRLSKRFQSPADLTGVISELSGPDGPLRAFQLSRSRSLTGSIRYDLTGEIDLADAAGVTGFDAAGRLAERAEAAGLDAAEVRGLLAGRARDGLRLSVAADLPGRDAQTWAAKVGDRVAVKAASSTRDVRRMALLGCSVVLAGGALAVVVSGRRRG